MGNLSEHLKYYEEAIKEGREDYYSSFGDFLGVNGMKQCDCCDQVFECDELDEGGECWECAHEDD